MCWFSARFPDSSSKRYEIQTDPILVNQKALGNVGKELKVALLLQDITLNTSSTKIIFEAAWRWCLEEIRQVILTCRNPDLLFNLLKESERQNLFYQNNQNGPKQFLPEVNAAGLCIRILLEAAASLNPHGKRLLKPQDVHCLLALARYAIDFGIAYDAQAIEGLIIFELEEEKKGRLRLHISNEAHIAIITIYQECMKGSSTVDYRVPKEYADPLNVAFTKNYGASFLQIKSVVEKILEEGSTKPVKCMSKRRLTEEILPSLLPSITPAESQAALQFLTFIPNLSWPAAPKGFAEDEGFPWRFSRARSALRQSFFLLESKGEEFLCFAPTATSRAWLGFLEQLTQDRVKGLASDVQRVLSTIANDKAEFFEQTVADVYKRAGLIVDQGVVSIDGMSLRKAPEGDLGNIDVLAFELDTRTIYVVEAKNFSIARNPREFLNDFQKLAIVPSSSSPLKEKKSAFQRHQARVEWVEKHIDMILPFYGIEREGSWKVRGLFVTDHQTLAPYLRELSFDVVSLPELASHWRI